jgi:hypothetical protein
MRRLTYVDSWVIALVGAYLFMWLIGAGYGLLVALAHPDGWLIRLAGLVAYFGSTALAAICRHGLGTLYREENRDV